MWEAFLGGGGTEKNILYSAICKNLDSQCVHSHVEGVIAYLVKKNN